MAFCCLSEVILGIVGFGGILRGWWAFYFLGDSKGKGVRVFYFFRNSEGLEGAGGASCKPTYTGKSLSLLHCKDYCV